MTSSKYFYLEYISLAIIYTCYHYHGGAIDHGKLLLLRATPYTIYNLIDLAVVQGQDQPGYSKRAYYTYLSEIISPCVRQPGYVRQVRARLVAVVYS